ncbi:MAG: hypothetical protein A2Y07_07720 [Planctomycetes bacterium GWF2_50_10]|nr:MAG: hypothetical protein A2Y07_07720 [Planctomycetes bacterium GWF2_50_10]
MEKQAKLITFVGTVQGVGFRYTAHRIATHYELTGYVRNLFDGGVEMLAQGHSDDIADCIEDLKQSFGQYIRNIDIKDIEPDEQYSEFTIRV